MHNEKERPIPFSAPMVRAILAGTKTQTRRVLKPQAHRVDGGVPFGNAPAWAHAEPGSMVMRCPYGKRGDRLWVREAYRFVLGYDGHPPRDVSEGVPVRYEAEGLGAKQTDAWLWGKGRPGMFMPRWASRITLEVAGVRAERLQDISEADAQSEGILQHLTNRWYAAPGLNSSGTTARAAFALLWNSINGPGAWDANPWVWVVEFKRLP